MSSRSGRRFPVRHPVVVVDIGCSCRRPKLSSLFSLSSLKLRSRKESTNPFSPSSSSATSLWGTSTAANTTTTTTSTTPSYGYRSSPSPMAYAPVNPRRERKKKKAGSTGGRVTGESVEVVKESSEPYLDFKESMLQMIVENEMYGWDELNDLLHRLLSLNSPDTHPLILRAFADIWRGIIAAPSSYE